MNAQGAYQREYFMLRQVSDIILIYMIAFVFVFFLIIVQIVLIMDVNLEFKFVPT